jgi:hypothetical protein
LGQDGETCLTDEKVKAVMDKVEFMTQILSGLIDQVANEADKSPSVIK